VASAGVGLVMTAQVGPSHGGVDDLFDLVTDAEQAADFGEAQADPTPESWDRVRRAGGGGAVAAKAALSGGVSDVAGGWVSPFFARCRRARTARKVWATMARVMCRYQA
jgi:hypothetical protein